MRRGEVYLTSAGIPVVMFNRGQDDPRLSEVTSDNIAGGRKVTDFLLRAGHQRIDHIAGWSESSTGRDRAPTCAPSARECWRTLASRTSSCFPSRTG